MKFGFVTLGTQVPSTRFRFVPYLPTLRELGHECHHWSSYPSVYEHLPWLGWRLSHQLKRLVRRYQIARSKLLRPDSIYLERGCLNDDSLDLDQALRKTTSRLILDVDDGIFLERPQKVDHLLAMSDHVVVSNEPIAEYIGSRHQHMTIIPTIVSVQRFVPKPLTSQANPKPVIGWIGTRPNMPFLDVCAEALRKLSLKYDFELFIVAPSAEPLKEIDLRGVDVNFRKWTLASEIQDLQRMDIGLMPLPAGQDWMNYKAATKLVQYLAVGIPAVASAIGSGARILEGNDVGFAAQSTPEWISALETLLETPELRLRLGSAGRKLVCERYSLEANAPRLEAVLSGAKIPELPMT